MKKYIKIKLDGEEESNIYIEAYNTGNNQNESEGGYGIKNIANPSGTAFAEKGKEFLDTSLDTIGKYSKKVMDKLKSTQYNLDEIEVEFSAGFDFEGNLLIASAESNLGMKLKLKWKNKENKEEK